MKANDILVDSTTNLCTVAFLFRTHIVKNFLPDEFVVSIVNFLLAGSELCDTRIIGFFYGISIGPKRGRVFINDTLVNPAQVIFVNDLLDYSLTADMCAHAKWPRTSFFS